MCLSSEEFNNKHLGTICGVNGGDHVLEMGRDDPLWMLSTSALGGQYLLKYKKSSSC